VRRNYFFFLLLGRFIATSGAAFALRRLRRAGLRFAAFFRAGLRFAAFLRAGLRFAAFLRAGLRFAAFLRAGLRFAAFLRAGLRFAAFLRAGLRFAAFLRAGLRFAAFLRAGFLRAVDFALRRDRFAALRGIQFTSLLRSDDLKYAIHRFHVPTKRPFITIAATRARVKGLVNTCQARLRNAQAHIGCG
jgi:hypothetical protein